MGQKQLSRLAFKSFFGGVTSGLVTGGGLLEEVGSGAGAVGCGSPRWAAPGSAALGMRAAGKRPMRRNEKKHFTDLKKVRVKACSSVWK